MTERSEQPVFTQGVAAWSRVALGAVAVLAAIAAAATLIGMLLDVGAFSPGGATIAAVATAAVSLGRTGLRIDKDGITVRSISSQTRGSWEWSRIREVALARNGGSWALAVRPAGSTWDTPGPSSPAVPPVRRLGNNDRRERLLQVLQHYCERHDVPLTRSRDGFGSAPPGSPLRSDS